MKNEEIKEVYIALRDRIKNPVGEFDKGGRFYAEYSDLMNVRTPSRSWPYSEMKAARTLKFVRALAETCQNIDELKQKAWS